uniref:Uncharacterized protein n=1 Tax=Oryza glumipatula TaxID=40148 RepID=A0A0E0ANM3_9ORYZ
MATSSSRALTPAGESEPAPIHGRSPRVKVECLGNSTVSIAAKTRMRKVISVLKRVLYLAFFSCCIPNCIMPFLLAF